ncbi:MAG: THUMP domain-containing protein [Candidatus Woesearchaeota archaeon]|nr:THUMP domain-containing protein [Candidatus Woesearchaeota archaeon]
MRGVLCILKQHELELAVAEAKALIHGWGWWNHKEQAEDGTLFFKGKRKIPQELALTRKIIHVLAVCAPGKLQERLKTLEIPVQGSFRVVLTKKVELAVHERELASIVWQKQQATVDLLNPETIVEIVLTKKKAYIGLRAQEYKGDFEIRRAHLLPAPHPTGMHPALARAFVHLVCVDRIHDPFCGAGGLVLEAGLAGKKISGADIEPKMIARAKKNCSAYYLRPELRLADATVWLPKAAIVTDLPYGKGTKPVNMKSLLEAFLLRAKTSCDRMVLGLPCEMKNFHGWKVCAHFSSYIHKHMTRHFYVLER